MAELEGALARVPGLAGYLSQEQFTQRANTATLANANQAAKLQEHFQTQARERGLREALGVLGPNATDDERLSAITPFVSADKAFGAIEGRMGREATARNTREIAMARLAQQASQFARTATTAEQRLAVDTWFKKGAREIALGRAFHELPEDILKSAGIVQSQPPAAAQQTGAMPSYQQALDARGGRLNAPFTMEVDPASPQPVQEAAVAPSAPVATPAAPAPVAEPVAPPEQPATPMPDAGNLDARDLAARAAPAPVQGAPVARGEVPPPQGAPVARSVPQPPPEVVDGWRKQYGRKRADMMAAQWTAEQVRAQVKGTGSAVVGDFTKTGDEFLATLPLQDRELVKKIANYDVDPKTLETRGGQRSRMLNMVAKFDPTYDDTQYANKRRAIAQFGSGPQGNTVRSLNVAIEHIDTLKRAGEALKNGNFTPANYAYNEVAKLFGRTPPNTFEGMRDIVANEVVKGTIGTAGALMDRQEAAAKVKAAASPAQLIELMNGWTELMGGQVKGLERQYEGATKLKDFRERYMTPRAIDAIALAESKATGVRAPAGALQMLRSNPTVPMKEAFKKKYGYLPDGI